MLEFRTNLDIQSFMQPFEKAMGQGVDHSDAIVMQGSCFSNNLGDRLREHKFKVHVNPFGTLYNPLSINRLLLRALHGGEFTSEEFFAGGELFRHFDLHGHMARPTLDEAVAAANGALNDTHQALTRPGWLMITWGSAWAYRLQGSKRLVANCHKQPQSLFQRELLARQTLISHTQALVAAVRRQDPNKKILFTLSPVRHLRDGFWGNQVSKGQLTTALYELSRQDPS